MKRVGVFSGTFDPVHRGHLAFALSAQKRAQLDTVVFLPEHSPRGKIAVGSFTHRLEMLRLATKHADGFEVLALDDQQFTIDKTLPELQSHFHQAQLVLLCGSDVVRTLSTRWPGVEILFTQTELVVGVREGESRIDLKALLEALPVQPRVTFVEGPHAQVSATEVRAGNLFATDPLVREYIQTNRLYQPA